MKRRFLCWVGFHESVLNDHGRLMNLWADVHVECLHCGKRKVYRCHDDTHWSERHKERVGERFRWFA
jgi:hypothetical protein